MLDVNTCRDQYWRTRPYGIGTRPHFRLEDLPPEIGNAPPGRGPSVAAGRGADVERVLEIVVDGAEVDHEPYHDAVIRDNDSPWYTGPCTWIESKSCVNRYPSGVTGTFRIWKHNHNRLMWFSKNYYFFFIYKVNQMGGAIEIGKIMTSAEKVDRIIGNNWLEYDSTKRQSRRYVDLKWTRVMSELGIPIDMLRNWELVHA